MDECTFVVMGATGDLSKRKLIPAIYHLLKNKKIKKAAIVGAAITETKIETILRESKKYIKNIDKKTWEKLESISYYCTLDFYNKKDFQALKKLILKVEKKHKLSGNRIFYFATLPKHFESITKQLAQSKIITSTKKSRVVYEKPFGQDLKSAKKINRVITKVFDESQIFRIDHYLWKELVGNIALIRFTNLFFEPLWNKDYIQSVQIILDEDLGVGTRATFYDAYGALKDVVQNHMLQMLALITMEAPKKLDGRCIRDAKSAVLKNIKYKDCLLGQFEGYKTTQGVKPKSKTETFAALALTINNKRWQGVPFFLKTGKMLSRKETAIHITFKQPACLKKVCAMNNNILSIIIQPSKGTALKDGFYLELNAKTPGKAYETTPVKMNFCHACQFGPNTTQAYEALLEDVILGDQSAFVRFDEVEYSWKLIDKILKKKHKIYSYKKKSNGPKELKVFSKKHKVIWR